MAESVFGVGKLILAAVVIITSLIGMYLLYINGYLVMNSKRAVMYIGSMRGRKASFTSCSGYTKRVVRFEKSGRVQFDFQLELSKGTVTAELLDASRQRVWCLSSECPSTSAWVEEKRRYYLVVRFQSASGKYWLKWD